MVAAMRQWAVRLGAILFWLALANFSAFFVVGLFLGGVAFNGKVKDGHYFLMSHGLCVVVPIWLKRRHAVCNLQLADYFSSDSELAGAPMIALLYVALSLIGCFPDVAAIDTEPQMHKWTDASGSRHAQAALISVAGDKISLRRIDGKLVSAKLSGVSESDRQYVATTVVRSNKLVTKSDRFDFSLVQQAVDQYLRRFLGPASNRPASVPSEQSPAPATLAYLRISKDFLDEHTVQTVRHTDAVHDVILGTGIEGKSQTVGQTRLVLEPSDDRIAANVEFVGTVHSQTVGHNGPATMNYLSASTFRARKAIAIGDAGITTEDSVASAPTHQWATSITTNLPGLFGRIAERVAWRRVSNSQAQADAIVSQHTAASIRRGFDRSIDESVAAAQTAIQNQLAAFKIENGSSHVRYRTKSDCIEVALVRNDASPEELAVLPSIEGNPQIALRVHRSILGQSVAKQLVGKTTAASLVSFLEPRIAQKAIGVLGTDSSANAIKCSADSNWLAVDFNDVNGDPAPPIAANTIYR
jgi:hypothetical protein